MENKKIYDSLNKETQTFMNEVFSYIDYFSTKNKDENEINIIASSVFLAGIKNIKFIKDYFSAQDITHDKIFKGSTTKVNSIEESQSFKTLDISYMLLEILNEIKQDYYLEDKDVKLSDMEPYQIFDYILDLYYDSIDKLLEEYDIEEIYSNDIFLNYRALVEPKYAEFALKWGVDIFKEVEEERLESYQLGSFHLVLDNNTLYISTINGKDEIITDIEDEEIVIPRMGSIEEINGEKVTPEVFDNFIKTFDSSNIFTFKIVDNKCNAITFTTYKTNMFKDTKISNVSKIMTTPNLTKYGEDLTKENYIKDPSVGRDEEIKRIMQVLLYPEKDKSIIITGEAGCGKTALVRGLAYRIQQGNVPQPLKDLKIISIDTATMVAGTKYVGTLEEKMKAILEEASKDKNIILFIDEIHQAISGGKSEGSDNTVSEILKPYLDYGKVRVIGATTTEEYAEYVEPNKAFKTRFKKITVKEPSEDVIYQIIDELITAYNKISYSKLLVSAEEKDMLIRWLIESTKTSYRTYNDRSSNPRLILDIIKEVYAIAALDGREEITRDDFIKAIKCEERLYESSRNRQAELLARMMPKPKRDCIILEFKPRK